MADADGRVTFDALPLGTYAVHAFDAPTGRGGQLTGLAIDRRNLMRRAHGDFFRGRLSLGDPQAAEPAAARYDAMWDESTPCLPAHTLGL